MPKSRCWQNLSARKILSKFIQFSLVQFISVTQSCPTLCDPMECSTPELPAYHQLAEFVQTHVHWVGDAIQPSHPLSSPSPPALNLTQHQGLFKWVSSSIRWAKYWSFSFSISPSNEYSGLISFKMDWLNLLAVQGTLKNLLQHHSSNASILWHSVFFIHGEGNGNPLQYSCLENSMDRGVWQSTFHWVAKSWTRLNNTHTTFFIVQLSHPYMTTGKTRALTTLLSK